MPGLIILDPNDASIGFSTGDDQAAGVYLDIETDTLYLTDLSNIIQWEGSSSANMTYTWRSGRVRLPRKANMAAIMVEADSYDSVIVKLYAVQEGELGLITTVTVENNTPVRLPGGYESNLYEIEVTSTDRISGISVASNIFDLAAG